MQANEHFRITLLVQNRLQNALANAILTGEFPEGSTIKVVTQHGELTFEQGR